MQDAVVGCTMIPNRAFARSNRARRTASTAASCAFRAAAVFGLSVLLASLVVPLVGLVLASEPPPFCCSNGRCCCADGEGGKDERSCLRRGCGCEGADGAVTGVPWRIEAELSESAPTAIALPVDGRWRIAGPNPIARADEPPVPPPRRSPLA